MSDRSRSIAMLSAALASCALMSAALAQDAVNATTYPQQVPETGAEDAAPAAAAARTQGARAAASEQALQTEALYEQLEEMTSESGEGLTTVKHANGMVTVDLQGRFHSVLVATPRADGGHDIECHSGDDAVHAALHSYAVKAGKAQPNPAQKTPVLEEK